MRFILVNLFLILLFSCDKNPASDEGAPDSGEEITIDYSICSNCIWLQNDCNGDWIIGYNFDSAISGFQFDIDGTSINSAYGGDAYSAGFTVSTGNQRVIGFSFAANFIPAGSGTLCILDLEGNPTGLSGITISDLSASELDVQNAGLVNCYSSSLDNTGESQLTIFKSSINNLEIGDEIGIFDLNGFLNHGDCSNQKGELLVGAGIWEGEQLNMVSIGSVDLCNINGVQLSGYVEGHPLVVKIYRSSNGVEYSTELSWGTGSGFFGEILQSIDSINLINSSLSKRLF